MSPDGSPKRMKFLSIILCFHLLGAKILASNPWSPIIELGARGITVGPAKLHLAPSKAKLDIVEVEGCDAKVQSSSAVQFGDRCNFLRGVYQYSFKQPGDDRSLRVYSEFFLHYNSSKSTTFLVNSPIVVHEGESKSL
ncbi:MAG: hypothetical protein EBR01_05855 [Proteobacteria bacterium]|nr:hypothetical protein [Pseudomonadota bacterium]NBY19606.1 hypothetical protein [bacterium]